MKDCHIFLPTKQWFSYALPKAMNTCFKAILIITQCSCVTEGFVTFYYENSLG